MAQDEAQPGVVEGVDAAAPASGDAPAAAPHPRRWRHRALVGLGVLLILAGGAALGGAALTRRPPRWWRPIDPADRSVREAALRLENGAATQLTRIRHAEGLAAPAGVVREPAPPPAPAAAATTAPRVLAEAASEPWTVKVSAEDASAWLSTRLRPWLESQEDGRLAWPEGLGQVQVDFDGGVIRVGAMVTRDGSTRVLAASVRPEFRADGALWLPGSSVSVGRLSMPASWVVSDRARASGPAAGAVVPDELARLPKAKDLMDALAGRRPAMRSPVLRIGDGRRVRLLGLRAEDGALYVTCQTLPREGGRAEK